MNPPRAYGENGDRYLESEVPVPVFPTMTDRSTNPRIYRLESLFWLTLIFLPFAALIASLVGMIVLMVVFGEE